ncbi:MAG: response regulator transcription factor [Anaerolineaceae bacterium]|nr:response regulator transcription factor [Anaerolineaceae bacterium]
MQGDGNFTGCGEKIPVFTVFRNNLLRKTVQQLIEACPCLASCGEADLPQEMVQQIENSPIKPKVVLWDIFSPEADTAFIPHMKAYYPDIHVLCVSGHYQDDLIHQALAAGASGYLLKDEISVDLLPKAIQDVTRDSVFISPNAQALLDGESMNNR